MRLIALLPAAVAVFLLLAPAALADSTQEPLSGEGNYGEAPDKVVTNAGFILIAFFPLFVAVMSVIQWRLDKRKEAKKAAQKQLKSVRGSTWRGGW